MIELIAYFYTQDYAVRAAEQLQRFATVQMYETDVPVQGRPWAIHLSVANQPGVTSVDAGLRANVLGVVQRFNGYLAEQPQGQAYHASKTAALSSGNRMHSVLPDPAWDRYYAEHPDEPDHRLATRTQD